MGRHVVVILIVWAILAVPLVVIWWMAERGASPARRMELAVARDERRIRKLVRRGLTDREIVAHRPRLDEHHVARVRRDLPINRPAEGRGDGRPPERGRQ